MPLHVEPCPELTPPSVNVFSLLRDASTCWMLGRAGRRIAVRPGLATARVHWEDRGNRSLDSLRERASGGMANGAADEHDPVKESGQC